MDSIGSVRLRVSGCGKQLDVELESSASVGALLDRVGNELGGLQRGHIKLLFRGKRLGEGNENVSLEAAGVRDRTKLMAMHTALYHKHGEAIKAMDALAAQFDAVDPADGKLRQEVATQVLCKLDGVETGGDDWLRARRKALIVRINAAAGST
mmetsp:Transcript_8147/g.24369  ORF Transcript_8147/g.24369 Transcript_8147/m.24369 type:complete len:153 (+) Transcript_8147:269-727(+)